jgi:hypothetical protein
MMSKQSRKEYAKEAGIKYLRASKKEKTKLLDDLVSFTGYNRKYAIGKLSPKNFFRKKAPAKKRKKIYDSDVIVPLIKIWETLNYPCSVRLHSQISTMLSVLAIHGEIKVSEKIKEKLLQIKPRTIDRKLKREKEVRRIKNKRFFATTKPGTLKSKIPMRKGAQWEEDKPGYLEIDTVAHNGGDPEGIFVYTLNATDIYSGWTESIAGLGKSKQVVIDKGLCGTIIPSLPFRMKGVDGDSGSEIINDLLYFYCLRNNITFTRSRPYHSNDGAHVEEKNWTHIRKIVGYGRMDTLEEIHALNSLYRNELRLYMNFFQPHMKCVKKEYTGSKVKKKYEIKTPYQYLLESDEITQEKKLRLQKMYHNLNPVYLKNEIERKKKIITKISKH